MTDSTTSTTATQTTEAAPEATDETAAAATAEPAGTSTETAEEPKTVEFLTKELERVRGEAAQRRVQLQEVRDQLANAKSPEEYAALETALADVETKYVRERVARQHNLPDAIASRLTGTTEEELAADAKVLSALLAATAEPEVDPANLNGGLNPANSDEDFDPVAIATRARTRRR